MAFRIGSNRLLDRRRQAVLNDSGGPWLAFRRITRRLLAVACLPWTVPRNLTFRLLSTAADTAARSLAAELQREIAELQTTLAELKENHRRETERLSSDVLLRDRQISQLTDIIARDRERVRAEIAMHARSREEALRRAGEIGSGGGGESEFTA